MRWLVNICSAIIIIGVLVIDALNSTEEEDGED